MEKNGRYGLFYQSADKSVALFLVLEGTEAIMHFIVYFITALDRCAYLYCVIE